MGKPAQCVDRAPCATTRSAAQSSTRAIPSKLTTVARFAIIARRVLWLSTPAKKRLAFREKIDAHEAAELARIRKKLKLTQMQAGQLAGGGKNAFSRYERGHAKPVSAVVNLFRLLDRHPELLGELTSLGQK
jgi:DNA-binding transcriptional regulator YiaG